MFNSIINEVKSIVESQGFVVSVEFKDSVSGWNVKPYESYGAKFDISW